MWNWWQREKPGEQDRGIADRIRSKYSSFRELLTLNNECLELIAGLQEDLQYAPLRRDVIEGRVETIFGKVAGVVISYDKLSGAPHPALTNALQLQRTEIERYAAHQQELNKPRLSAWLSEIDATAEAEAGTKAALLGEIRNEVGLPVPEGFILTTEAYRQYCGIPMWKGIRDATRNLDLSSNADLRRISGVLGEQSLALPLPLAVEVAITGRSRALLKNGGALAVRSSGVGEGADRTYAGQFVSLLNVPLEQAVDAYRRVIAGRFSEKAQFYRVSTGLPEVDTPLAVLFLLMVPAKAAGIMYTRDPSSPKGKGLWITATRGLSPEIVSGRMSADLFVLAHSRPHAVLERSVVRQERQFVTRSDGGITLEPLRPGALDDASLREEHLRTLAEWGGVIEDHFKAPQDIEWVLDSSDKLWIVQSRPLTQNAPVRATPHYERKVEPVLAGGRTVYPGKTSGPVYLLEDQRKIADVPDGAIVFIRRPSPEIIEIFPKITGLVAELGNVAGHAATLLREFRVPSVFEMTGAFDCLRNGDPVSLDSIQARAYPGTLWPPQSVEPIERRRERTANPLSRRLLKLNLLDPSARNFRPAGCKSAHDVLRYCHEKAIGAMFEVSDLELAHTGHYAHELATRLPLNMLVLDLGGGLALSRPEDQRVEPERVVSRPFQALWKGISHPGVSWTREMPTAIGDLASVLAHSLTPHSGGMRGLGEKSYLLVAGEYMNLNSRLAYHYSLVDACLSDIPGNNYVSFRFEGGGATRRHRSLRACFIEKSLVNYGFHVDRRGDLVNAWLREAPAEYTAERLDILGRLMACSSQLDMYMDSDEMMAWCVKQFLAGNYLFRTPASADPAIQASPANGGAGSNTL